MNFRDIAETIDKSKYNEDMANLMDIGDELGIDMDYIRQDRLTSYWVGRWNCTDAYVGYRMYFFDGEPVAFSTQVARKNREEFEWFSEDRAQEVRKYLLSLIDQEEYPSVQVVSMDEDVGDTFTIEFNDQVIDEDVVWYEGERVEIIEKIKKEPYTDQDVRIRFPEGDEKVVVVGDLDFGFRVNY